ncbi:MAG: GDYXXLXY domain-containing protein [Mariprofundales bacterium]
MNRSFLIKSLITAIVFQFLILTGMLIKANYPLWVGNEVRVKTIPVDPRSLFRGNYARLNYEISRLPKAMFLKKGASLRPSVVVYVSLKKAKNNIYQLAAVSLNPPDAGVFLKGRIINNNASYYNVKYGIEAFFAPKEKALRLERELSKAGVAVLMVTDGGSVALKDVLASSIGNDGSKKRSD